ncbi:hypothetical protein AWC38_SpisGene24098 [Stylophora pistillata]|uniref:Uncharacterized protein n=1 Tax=Stylophora pistillata TaxID=50429 RepID=A0A2B4R694_STYPI|nr:hypothetical protein AWC38_SpisGene24098 [Stylophora pistillata]
MLPARIGGLGVAARFCRPTFSKQSMVGTLLYYIPISMQEGTRSREMELLALEQNLIGKKSEVSEAGRAAWNSFEKCANDYRGRDNIADDKQEDLSTSIEAVGGNGLLRNGNDGAGRGQVPVVGTEQVPVVNDGSSGSLAVDDESIAAEWRRREMGWLMFSMTRFSPSKL